jgi:hypothetical protein
MQLGLSARLVLGRAILVLAVCVTAGGTVLAASPGPSETPSSAPTAQPSSAATETPASSPSIAAGPAAASATPAATATSSSEQVVKASVSDVVPDTLRGKPWAAVGHDSLWIGSLGDATRLRLPANRDFLAATSDLVVTGKRRADGSSSPRSTIRWRW